MEDDLPIRHIERNVRVPMYRTNIACAPSGPFAGPMVVSMRPFKPADAIRAVQITSRFPSVHGAPVHLGHPHSIGIADIAKPDYGDPVPVEADEIPVFWACGVTPQAVIAAAKLGSHRLRPRSEEHTSELQSHLNIVCRLLLEKKKTNARAP